jgi:transcriptional regulator with XRE-family HTH domain
MPDDKAHLENFARVLGRELLAARHAAGMTRREMRAQLPTDLSMQTLATYEQGTRIMSVTRLIELCMALNVSPLEVMRRAYEKKFAAQDATAGADDDDGGWWIDLRAAAVRTDLRPLAKWAQLRVLEGDEVTVRLDSHCLGYLCTLCGLDREALRTHLPLIDPERAEA